MVPIRWIEKRKPHWQRLEELVELGGKGLRKMSGRDLQELGLLYRQTASDLSVVLEDRSSRQLAVYLNQLLGRSHNLLYFGHRIKVSRIGRFYADTYPRIFRETLSATGLATCLFAVTMLAAWAITLRDPGFAQCLLGTQMIDTIDRHEMWTKSVVAIKPLAASGIATNNLSVAFSMFAFGITGIGTIWMIVFNGLLLGTVGAATWHAGMALPFWSFVAPHGVLELPAIFIAAGSGLTIARGLLFPGMLPRRQSLAQASGQAVRLLLGTIPLLLVAGTIEGFISPSALPPAMKFSLAAVLLPTLLVWLLGKRAQAGQGRANQMTTAPYGRGSVLDVHTRNGAATVGSGALTGGRGL
jgi:uncharacterized membrane protein SpoIIM required for sporulation